MNILKNLGEIIEALPPKDYDSLIEKLEKSRFLGLVQEINHALQDNYDPDELDHYKFKFKSKDWNNDKHETYKIVLKKLVKINREKEFKQWQLEIAENLDEVEALCELELYNQAAFRLRGLEEKWYKSEYKISRFFDDVSLSIRLAQVKFSLASRSDLLELDEIEGFVAGYFSHGESIFNFATDKSWHYDITKNLGFELLAEYAKQRNDFKSYVMHKSNQIELAKSQKDIAPDHYLMLQLELAFMCLKHGDYTKYQELSRPNSFNWSSPLIALVLEQHLFDLALSLDSEVFSKKKSFADLEKYTNPILLINEERLSEYLPRNQFNKAIISFLKKDYDTCLKLIPEFKRDLSDDLKRDLSFLQTMVFIGSKRILEIPKLTRRLENLSAEFEFEQAAVRLLKTRSNISDKDFPQFYSGALKDLEDKQIKGNPMHKLILAFLKNQI
ncbi:MAG: hypothetical protein ABJG41_14570 [Cyclobacteriaceae bacterium]